MVCSFCDLITRPDDLGIVDVGADTAALLDHAPVFFGHALVVPIVHVERLLVAPSELAAMIMVRTQEVARAAMLAYHADGILTVINSIISQSVPHLHIHVIPRRRGDGLRGFLWPRRRYPTDATLADHRNALGLG
ncbi:MAG: HIT family protein [Ferrimicrobium sp.]|jgi:histidine triad (HIT) family protein